MQYIFGAPLGQEPIRYRKEEDPRTAEEQSARDVRRTGYEHDPALSNHAVLGAPNWTVLFNGDCPADGATAPYPARADSRAAA